MGWEAALAQQQKRGSDPAFWEDYLARNPDVLNELLADLHKVTRGHQPATLESLWDMLAPKFTNDPLNVSVRLLLRGQKRSQRWLAQQLRLDHRTLMWWIDEGNLVAAPRESMRRIEAIAVAFSIHPSFFPEWRRLWFVDLLTIAFDARPTLSASAYVKFAEHEVRGTPEMI